MLDANVVNYADPEFAGHGPAAAGGMITMQAIEALLADRATELGVEIKRGSPAHQLHSGRKRRHRPRRTTRPSAPAGS